MDRLENSSVYLSKRKVSPSSNEYYLAFSYNQELESIPIGAQNFTPNDDYSILISNIIHTQDQSG